MTILGFDRSPAARSICSRTLRASSRHKSFATANASGEGFFFAALLQSNLMVPVMSVEVSRTPHHSGIIARAFSMCFSVKTSVT